MSRVRDASCSSTSSDPLAATTCGLVRVGRGLTVGLVVAGTAAAGHAVGGGPVAPLALTTLGVAAVIAAVALSHREWRFPRLLLMLGGAQLVAHLWLTLIGHHGHTSMSTTPVPALRDHGMTAMPMSMSGESPAVVSPWFGLDLGMVVGHVLAAVICAWLLRRGEVALLALMRLLRSPAQRWRFVPAPVPHSAPVMRWVVEHVRAFDGFRFSVGRRGPPIAGISL